MNFLSGIVSGNANFDPMQMNQNTQMLKQQAGQWLQQQNSQLSMQAAQNPQSAQLLNIINGATNELMNDTKLPMIIQIDTLVQSAPQQLQNELRRRITEKLKGGWMRNLRIPMNSSNNMRFNNSSSGYGMGSSMGSSNYGAESSMGSSDYGNMGSTYVPPKSSSSWGGKIGRKSRKMTRTTGVKRGGSYNKMKGGTCKNR